MRLYQDALQKYPTQITVSLLRRDKATKKSYTVKQPRILISPDL